MQRSSPPPTAASSPSLDQGRVLLSIARQSVEESFGHASLVSRDEDWLNDPGATFVTITCDGSLRGCIGSIRPARALFDDVRSNALAAAFRDPRFPPLQSVELSSSRFEVSLLSPLERLPVQTRDDLLSQLHSGRDGLLLEYGRHTATFLPQVWESLPDATSFVGELKRKAGLPRDLWSPAMVWWRYVVHKWCEDEG